MKGILIVGIIVSLPSCGGYSDSGNPKVDTNKEKSVATEKAETQKLAEEKAQQTEQEVLQEQQEQEQMANHLGLELVTVARVVDGDTFETSDGRKIRLVGVNTPESTTRIEDYGKEASNYTSSKLSGKQVWLQKDVSDKDRYGRYLRVVWLSVPTSDMDESEMRLKMYNADLVLNGFAEPSTYPPDVKYSDYFVKFAREARAANTGLWSLGVQGTTKGDLDSENSNTSGANSSSGSTAGGTSSGGSESFKNCTELRKVYPDGVPSTHPAYASRHDRDKDNWACE